MLDKKKPNLQDQESFATAVRPVTYLKRSFDAARPPDFPDAAPRDSVPLVPPSSVQPQDPAAGNLVALPSSHFPLLYPSDSQNPSSPSFVFCEPADA